MTKKDRIAKAKEALSKHLDQYAEPNHILKYNFLWEKDDMFRFRVDLRNEDTWKVKRSWFSKVDAKKGWSVSYVED